MSILDVRGTHSHLGSPDGRPEVVDSMRRRTARSGGGSGMTRSDEGSDCAGGEVEWVEVVVWAEGGGGDGGGPTEGGDAGAWRRR